MPFIIVERFVHKGDDFVWKKSLLNTDLIAASLSSYNDDSGSGITYLRLTQRVFPDDKQTIVVKGTLNQLRDRIAVANDKDYEAPVDLEANAAAWAAKLAKEKRR